MADFYAMQIRLGKMAIEDVPEKWRDEVRSILQNG